MRKLKFSIAIIVLSLLLVTVYATPGTPVMGIWRDTNPTAYINPPANPKLNSLFMLSATEGWAVGDSQPTKNTTTLLSSGTLVSTALPAIFHYDGSTWNLVPAPRFPDFPYSPSAYNLTSVTFGPPSSPFISREDGWAVGFNITAYRDPSLFPNPEFPANCLLLPAPQPTLTCPTYRPPNATALHWDGTAWRVQTAGLGGVNAGPLWSAFMVSSTDIWAVGQNRTGTGLPTGIGGTFWHWTGVPGLGGGWNLVQQPVSNVPYSVFMVSATEGWAVGSGGAIYHYTAGSWTSFSSPVSTPLRSVYMLSPTEGWAVGDSGVVLHYVNGIWTGPVSPGTTTNNLFSVVMVSSTEGWAAGVAGAILHYSGGSWTLVPPNLVPTSPVSSFNFNSLFANSATDIWSVGTAGVILHWDGSSWGSVTSPTFNNFTSISFGPPPTPSNPNPNQNPNDGWAVGNASLSGEPTIYHWNGFMWTKGVTIGTTNDLNSAFMLNGGDVWTVGGGKNPTASCSTPPTLCPVILHFTGGSWNTITPPPGNYRLKGVFMVSSNEGWAVGQTAGNGPIILHYTVTGGVGGWATFPAPSTPTPIHSLNSVFMLSPTEGWAVGDNATILHYTVSGGVGTWNLVTVSGTPGLSMSANLTNIFMLSPTSGWAVGGIQLPLPAGGSYSAGPVIIYWDGTKWTPVPTPTIPAGLSPTGHTAATLKSIYCTRSDDCWATGLPGKVFATILHWDGIAWNHVITSPALMGEEPPILSSVYMISQSSGWVVGSSPRFLTITSGGALSTILRFASFGGLATMTATSTVVSTVTTATTLLTASTVSTATSLKTTTAITTITSSVTGGGIPGFPVESILAGLAFGLVTLSLLRRRRKRNGY